MSKVKKAKPNQQAARKPERPTGDIPIKDHILMVNDVRRSQAYFDAMKAKIRPGNVVLEVGTGAGLLACAAARLGARQVYTVEQSAVLHRVAQKVLATNGVADKVTLINAHSKDLVGLNLVREPIDVFVTETIGSQGLDEGIATIYDHVRPLLSPTARVIPELVRFRHCLVNLSGIREQLQIMHPILGVDLRALNQELKSNNHYWMEPIEPWREVSSTATTPDVDFLDFRPQPSTHELEIVRDNVCDGMLCWAEFRLADGIVLETRNRDFGAGWANSLYLMKRGLVMRGHSCSSEFKIAEDKITWTLNWRVNRNTAGPEPTGTGPMRGESQ